MSDSPALSHHASVPFQCVLPLPAPASVRHPSLLLSLKLSCEACAEAILQDDDEVTSLLTGPPSTANTPCANIIAPALRALCIAAGCDRRFRIAAKCCAASPSPCPSCVLAALVAANKRLGVPLALDKLQSMLVSSMPQQEHGGPMMAGQSSAAVTISMPGVLPVMRLPHEFAVSMFVPTHAPSASSSSSSSSSHEQQQVPAIDTPQLVVSSLQALATAVMHADLAEAALALNRLEQAPGQHTCTCTTATDSRVCAFVTLIRDVGEALVVHCPDDSVAVLSRPQHSPQLQDAINSAANQCLMRQAFSSLTTQQGVSSQSLHKARLCCVTGRHSVVAATCSALVGRLNFQSESAESVVHAVCVSSHEHATVTSAHTLLADTQLDQAGARLAVVNGASLKSASEWVFERQREGRQACVLEVGGSGVKEDGTRKEGNGVLVLHAAGESEAVCVVRGWLEGAGEV